LFHRSLLYNIKSKEAVPKAEVLEQPHYAYRKQKMPLGVKGGKESVL
jgi:hypothetical protein